ncbi:MAG: hypothetical protein ACXABY_34340 [Candidatus Thorarchaeota archaeon]|jgi:hypothetical protein
MQRRFRLIAKDSIRYYEGCIRGHDNGDLRWSWGLEAASNWLHLIHSETVSYDEFEELIDDVQDEKHYRGSMLVWMIIHILIWGMTKAFAMPPTVEPEFLNSAKMYYEEYKKAT